VFLLFYLIKYDIMSLIYIVMKVGKYDKTKET